MKTSMIKIFVTCAFAALLTGCAVFGSDMQGLYDIKEAHVKVFDKDVASCYELTVKALKGGAGGSTQG